MPHIEYFCATLSPYVYLAGTRLEEIAAKHGATITYRPLDVMALFARTGGTAPKDRHPNRMDLRFQELRRQAKKHDMPMNLKPAHWPTNGAPSAYAVITAQADGSGDVGKLLAAICRSCWADEKDIAEDEVIRACLEEAGFDPAIADRGLLTSAEEYARNLEDGVAKGAFGTPFYITETDERFWGRDKLDDLDLHLAGKL